MGRINKVPLPRAWFEALRAPFESDKTQKRITICRLLGIQQQLQCCCCSGGENKLNLRLLRGLGHPASALSLYSWWKDKINQCCGKTRGKYLCRLFIKNRNILMDKINPWLILKMIKFGILKRAIFTVFRSQRTQSEQVAKTTRHCDVKRYRQYVLQCWSHVQSFMKKCLKWSRNWIFWCLTISHHQGGANNDTALMLLAMWWS